MSHRLPELFDPRRSADLGRRMSGRIRLDRLPRLAEVIEGGEAMVEVKADLGRDAEHRAVLTGRLRANLTLECQRCLGPMQLPLDVGFRLAIVETPAEAERLPDGLDPLLLACDEQVRLAHIVEDELLLALPQVAMHEPNDCAGPLWRDDAVPSSEADKPFAVLEALKRRSE
jgi:uncharacterized protein